MKPQVTWKYVETPPKCEFFECIIDSVGNAICLSDSCGVFEFHALDGTFEQLIVEPNTDSSRFVPRSIDVTPTGIVHIVGHTTFFQHDWNSQLRPEHYVRERGSEFWDSSQLSVSFGKCEVIRVVDDDNYVIAIEKRVPSNQDQFAFDTICVEIHSLNRMGLKYANRLSYDIVENHCGQRDMFTVRMTTDRENGMSVIDLAPCTKGPDPGYPPYSYRGWYSYDGGMTFPDYWGPHDPSDFSYQRPYRFAGPMYLYSDFWISGGAISRDQGKTWKRELIPISDRADSVSISGVKPGVIKGRFAVGCYVQEWIAGTKAVYAFGTFNLENGVFEVEHRDTLEIYDPMQFRTSKTGYAITSFSKHGLYVRIPDPSTSVPSAETIEYRIRPNPASSRIAVDGTTRGQHLAVVNMLGQLVLEATAIEGTTMLDIEGLTNGYYAVVVSGSKVTGFVKW